MDCIECGGNEFYKDAGFYYCRDCQTQSQELVEQEYALHDETAAQVTRASTKRKIKKKQTEIEQVTSWECYNYIILGLVNELIDLGANEKLKPIVKVLWFKYLKAIEVIHEDPDILPNLQAYNNETDAEILYGRKRKRYKRSKSQASSPASSVGTENMGSVKRLQNKLKRVMSQADYEVTQPSHDTQSMNTQVLSSIKDSEIERTSKQLSYTKRATKELVKVMKKRHLKEHLNDVENELSCHKISRIDVSRNYSSSIDIITRTKIYSLIYVGLLIIKDDIQLGDMIRFMREGHLSYNYVKHFFPEELENKKWNLSTYLRKQKMFQSENIRETSFQLIKSLKVVECLPVQNLIHLCRRYCKELNLPETIETYTITLLSRTNPNMQIKTKSIPNYEARAICLIIFVLKLLFGLDSVTEFKLSDLSKLLDSTGENFNFRDWLNHLKYRQLILTEYHFPTAFVASKSLQNEKIFVDFLTEYEKELEIEREPHLECDIIDNLLYKLPKTNTQSLNFEHSLNPKRAYTNILLNSLEAVQIGILNRDFYATKVNFLNDINEYDVEFKNSGANSEIELVPIFQGSKRADARNENFIFTRVLNKKHFKRVKQDVNKRFERKTNGEELNTKRFLKRFRQVHKRKWERQQEIRSRNEIKTELENYVHYKPEKRFWLCSAIQFDRMFGDKFEDYYKALPDTFRFVIEECARIIEQPPKVLLEEYNIVEAHLCFNFDCEDETSTINKLHEGDAAKLLKNALEKW